MLRDVGCLIWLRPVKCQVPYYLRAGNYRIGWYLYKWMVLTDLIIGQESVERCWLPVLVPPCQVLTHLILGQEIIELDDKSVERCWLPVLVPRLVQVSTHLILGQEIIALDDTYGYMDLIVGKESVERCWLPVLVPPDPIMQRLHLIPCLSHQYNVE